MWPFKRNGSRGGDRGAPSVGDAALDERSVVIPRSDVVFDDGGEVLGSGRLGAVTAGRWLEQPVALKRIVPA
jgi:serine/threonine protein kinase